MRALIAGGVAFGLMVLALFQSAPLRAAGRSTKDGVYSAAQAERGKKAYLEICAGCHGLELEGAPFVAPTLKGIAFIENWRDDSVAALYGKIKSDMPMGSPERMSDADKLDVVAYLLKENALPPGSADLPKDDLASIVIDSPLDRLPVGDTALVRVIGCLTKDGSRFVMAKATTPTRSREGLPSSEQQLKAAGEVALGAGSFTLMDVLPAPDAHVGRRVDVKGILLLRPEGNAVNVTALQSTGTPCTP